MLEHLKGLFTLNKEYFEKHSHFVISNVNIGIMLTVVLLSIFVISLPGSNWEIIVIQWLLISFQIIWSIFAIKGQKRKYKKERNLYL
jgi:hypothetical protein